MEQQNIPTQDIRIKEIVSLKSPDEINALYPVSAALSEKIRTYRQGVNDIIQGRDKRMLAVVGPCSINNPASAIEYAEKLAALSKKVEDQFFVVMRAYFEKPRTILGWKGLILDPDMDGSYNIEKGLCVARKLLIDISEIGLPVGCEFLDPIVPQYIDELMSWASIGARTTESQTHRNLASGLSVAIGFKNSTSGELTNAINAVKTAANPASFIGINKKGDTVVLRTTGNDCGHLILRGGDHAPNYYEDDVESARRKMEDAGINPAIIVDCSHSNSRKDFRRQKRVLRSVLDQRIWGETALRGFMLESNLFEGNQKIPADISELKYGVSVTDACIGWEETERILLHGADLLREAQSNGGVVDIL
jgi:phospho-2-dehydro-3-deoxyheptonate aldolase